jgi:cobalamin-dependent methionine synthase I
MALFAVTLGQKISDEIDQRFKTNNFAEGCMLDAAASAGTDQAAEIMQKIYEQKIAERFDDFDAIGVARYSPGYCGWHISAQKKLFEYLSPDKIGIRLRETYLMDPLKSVSGVIIAGSKEIHQFENNYPCCENCDDQTCLERMRAFKNA